jgi:hypothetical protein
MTLFNSLLITTVTTVAIWGLVLIQPIPAIAASESVITTHTTEKEVNTQVTLLAKPPNYFVPLINQTISLSAVDALWKGLYSELEKKTEPLEPIDEIIIVYREFNALFTAAEVVVGYHSVQSVDKQAQMNLPQTKQKKILLARGKHTNNELEKSWQEIDFSQSIEAVVEVHYLNQHGLPDTNQLTVYYK